MNIDNFFITKYIKGFKAKYPNLFRIIVKDVKVTGRILFKAYVMVQVVSLVYKNVYIPTFSGNTWYFATQNVRRHPIVPPFHIPYPESPEFHDYSNFRCRVNDEITLNNIRLRYIGNDDPERETSTIIDEYLYDNDTDRMFEEMRFLANSELIAKGEANENDQISPSVYVREIRNMRKELKSKIKPA